MRTKDVNAEEMKNNKNQELQTTIAILEHDLNTANESIHSHEERILNLDQQLLESAENLGRAIGESTKLQQSVDLLTELVRSNDKPPQTTCF